MLVDKPEDPVGVGEEKVVIEMEPGRRRKELLERRGLRFGTEVIISRHDLQGRTSRSPIGRPDVRTPEEADLQPRKKTRPACIARLCHVRHPDLALVAGRSARVRVERTLEKHASSRHARHGRMPMKLIHAWAAKGCRTVSHF